MRILKPLLKMFLRILLRVRLQGFEVLSEVSGNRLFIANHLSHLDGFLLWLYLPGDPAFVVDHDAALRWWMRPWLHFVTAYRMDRFKPHVTRLLIKDISEGGAAVIFPEGRLSVTGRSLMKIYKGSALIADRTQATLIPIHIEGVQYSFFASLQGKRRQHLFPKVTISIGMPQRLPEHLRGAEQRQAATTWIYDLMSETALRYVNFQRTLFHTLLDARRENGGGFKIIEDMTWESLSYNTLITGAMVLGRSLVSLTKLGEAVGVLLPNMKGTAVVLFGLQCIGRVPTMLNYTSGVTTLQNACHTAQVRLILTSRLFVEKASLQKEIQALEQQATVVYVEDVRKALTLWDKAVGLLVSRFVPRVYAYLYPRRTDDPAFILFTSGSEGTPKGVVLSHYNLLFNVQQVLLRIDCNDRDKLFSALPLFHCFGLTCGLIMPVVAGVRTFLYVSPLHYKTIPQMIYDSNATIMFAADTFLQAYAQHAEPYDFQFLRYVFAGAEPLRQATRQQWYEKLGIRIYEGYGVTETSPVLSVNIPMYNRTGTVGRPLSGVEVFVESVEELEEGGCLWVKGGNVMLGYMHMRDPGVIVPPKDGWYNTGDVVSQDSDGYLRILGRLKRFAKIGGEMISLALVESVIGMYWSEYHHAVVAVLDERKGQRMVLVTTYKELDRSMLMEVFQERGFSEIHVPRYCLHVESIPLLATGKTDYPTILQTVHQYETTLTSL